eukprot:9374310-Alexandrium_andersonii.AAC.1
MSPPTQSMLILTTLQVLPWSCQTGKARVRRLSSSVGSAPKFCPGGPVRDELWRQGPVGEFGADEET